MNRFMSADPKSCIGCHTCEVACAIAHAEESADTSESSTDSNSQPSIIKSLQSLVGRNGGANFYPRLTLIKNATVSLPVMCRQCDDAPCLNACPSNAIVYEADTVQVIQERCIGCKSCVVACPYGAMQVISVGDTSHHPSASRAGMSRALKCDLCLHRKEGPACVASCPTNALKIIDHQQIETTVRQRQAQAALGASSLPAL